MRELVLAEEPLCKRCQSAESTHADHIVGVKRARALGWAERQIFARSNYQGLCGPCNSIKGIEEEGGLGRAPRVATPGGPSILSSGEYAGPALAQARKAAKVRAKFLRGFGGPT